MNGRVDHARLHSSGDWRTQHGVASAALYPYPVAVVGVTFLGILRMSLQPVLIWSRGPGRRSENVRVPEFQRLLGPMTHKLVAG